MKNDGTDGVRYAIKAFGLRCSGAISATAVLGAIAPASAQYRSPAYVQGDRHADDPWYGPDPGHAHDQYYAPDPGYAYAPRYDNEIAPRGDDDAYCAQRFRSYDPASSTYLGYDGLRHPCP